MKKGRKTMLFTLFSSLKYCVFPDFPAKENTPFCRVLSAFCENYHTLFISPLFNSAKIHAKGAIGLQRFRL